jgi:hypothetical protein
MQSGPGLTTRNLGSFLDVWQPPLCRFYDTGRIFLSILLGLRSFALVRPHPPPYGGASPNQLSQQEGERARHEPACCSDVVWDASSPGAVWLRDDEQRDRQRNWRNHSDGRDHSPASRRHGPGPLRQVRPFIANTRNPLGGWREGHIRMHVMRRARSGPDAPILALAMGNRGCGVAGRAIPAKAR